MIHWVALNACTGAGGLRTCDIEARLGESRCRCGSADARADDDDGGAVSTAVRVPVAVPVRGSHSEKQAIRGKRTSKERARRRHSARSDRPRRWRGSWVRSRQRSPRRASTQGAGSPVSTHAAPGSQAPGQHGAMSRKSAPLEMHVQCRHRSLTTHSYPLACAVHHADSRLQCSRHARAAIGTLLQPRRTTSVRAREQQRWRSG